MMSSHYNIATEGVRAGHKSMASLGQGTYVQIIVTQPPSSSGGGGFYDEYKEEKRYPYNPLFGLIHIDFYGKEEFFKFYPVHNVPDIQIEVNLFKYTIDRNTNAIIEVTLLESTKQIIKAPVITIKDKNYDSTKRIEQPRILIEHPKFHKQA